MARCPLHSLETRTWKREDGYELSTDRARIDIDVVDRFLREEAYWSSGLERARLEQALNGSVVIGVYSPRGEMAGFGRLVTDCTVFAYLRDVFVLPEHRSKGLATWIASAIREHPGLCDIPTWMLATKDAHGVYQKAGFEPVPSPQNYMSVPKASPNS